MSPCKLTNDRQHTCLRGMARGENDERKRVGEKWRNGNKVLEVKGEGEQKVLDKAPRNLCEIDIHGKEKNGVCIYIQKQIIGEVSTAFGNCPANCIQQFVVYSIAADQLSFYRGFRGLTGRSLLVQTSVGSGFPRGARIKRKLKMINYCDPVFISPDIQIFQNLGTYSVVPYQSDRRFTINCCSREKDERDWNRVVRGRIFF